MLYIHPDECVDCGACEPVCPVEAIFYEDDVPEQWKDYTAANYEFFDDLGSPGRRVQDRQDRQGRHVRRGPAAAGDRALTTHSASAGCRTSPGTGWSRPRPGAAAHPGGIVDLSIGTPVDPVPAVVQARARGGRRRARATRSTAGTPGCARRSRLGPAGLRRRRTGFGVLPTIGSKELVAWLPTLLGLGPGDVVVIPTVCYPTLRGRGAARRRHRRSAADSLTAVGPTPKGDGWCGSTRRPTRPDGSSRRLICARSSTGPASAAPSSPVTSATCRWAGRPHRCRCCPRLRRRLHRGARVALAVQTVEPRRLPGRLRRRRSGAGRGTARGTQARRDDRPGPGPGGHDRRARRRAARGRAARPVRAGAGNSLRDALVKAGFTIDHSEAGLYLWATRGEDCWATVDWLAERGHPGRAGRLLRPHRRPARTDRADRDRRTRGRRREPASAVGTDVHRVTGGLRPLVTRAGEAGKRWCPPR